MITNVNTFIPKESQESKGGKETSGKKKQYTNEMLVKAVEEMKAGASLRATSKNYNIPHTKT